MAKKLHLVHVKSSVADKAPSASTLDYGEIAVNYNSETPALYIRDDEDNIVKFIAEPYFNKIVGTGITENDGETITPLTEVIEQDELTVSAAFNDINNRLSDLSGVTAEILSDLNEKASTDYVDEAIAEALTGVTIDVDDHLDSGSTNPLQNAAIYQILADDEEAIAASLNDLNEKVIELSGVTEEINDALTDKEDITNKVTTLSSGSTNTQYPSAKAVYDAIQASVVEVDAALDSASTNPVENRVLTRIINENEMVTAAAINYLNDNKVGISEFDDLADDLDELASGIAMNYYTKGETPITGTTQTGSGNVVTSVTINDKVLSIALGEISGGDEAVSAVTINGTGNSVTDVSFIDKSLTLTKGNVQETLVSGTNIKTFAGQELLGAGEVVKVVSTDEWLRFYHSGAGDTYEPFSAIIREVNTGRIAIISCGDTLRVYDFSGFCTKLVISDVLESVAVQFNVNPEPEHGGYSHFEVFMLTGNNPNIEAVGDGFPITTDYSSNIIRYYQKPSTGIPATDLAQAVQTSLGKADTALQSADLTFIKGTGTGSAVLKDGGATATGQFAVAEGAAYSNTPTAAAGDASHAEGAGVVVRGQAAHGEGLLNVAGRTQEAAVAALADFPNLSGTTEQKVSKLIGFASHSEGSSTQALGTSSHAEGNSTQALVNSTHAEGDTTTASGEAAHSEGYKTTASGNQSHSEGFNTQATANQAHSEGKKTIASAENAHSEGNETKAVGNASHSEGYRTYAYGAMSHIEGTSSTLVSDANAASESVESIWEENGHNFSLSRGQGSHVEGKNCLATGDWSHAEGVSSSATKIGSHAEGRETRTTNDCEHAEGKYNKSNTNTISSIGIGTADNNRKNAFEVMQNGDIYVKGLGSYNGTNPAAAQTLKQVIDAKGTYSKPSGGIPATDLAQAVQTTLNNADKITVQYGETDSTKIGNASLCVLTGNTIGGAQYYGTLGLEFDNTPGSGRTFVGYGAKHSAGTGWQYPVLLRASYLNSVWSVTELGSYDSLITGVTVNGNVASVSNKVASVNVLPTYSSSDAGKVLRVSSTGTLEWVTPSTIYTGSGTPQQSLGNDGDVYLQTS